MWITAFFYKISMTERLVLKIMNMSPRTEQQYVEIREERRNQIMKVALQLIADEGFSQVSISKIAKKASISKGLMYNYFASKEELIKEIMNNGLKQLTDIFDPNKDGVLTEDEMHFFIDQLFNVLRSNIRFWRMYFMVMFQPEVFKMVEPKIVEALDPLMKTAQEYFIRNKYEDPEAEMRYFAAVLDGIALHYVLDPLHFPLEGIKKKLHAIYK